MVTAKAWSPVVAGSVSNRPEAGRVPNSAPVAPKPKSAAARPGVERVAGPSEGPAPQAKTSGLPQLRLEPPPGVDEVAPKVRAALPRPIAEALLAAAKGVKGPLRREVVGALELLSSRPDRAELAVAFLTHGKRKKVGPKDVEAFSKPTAAKPEVAERLGRFWRKTEANRALAGLPTALQGRLFDAIVGHGSAESVRWALAALEQWPRPVRGAEIANRLAAHPTEDPVLVLARARFAPSEAAPASGGVEGWVSRLQAAGICETPEWKKGDDSNRRGQLAEALRRLELAESPGEQVILQGALILEQPPGLAAAKTRAEAVAWCRRSKVSSDKLFEAKLESGPFALHHTELDFLVADRGPDCLCLRRLENVKAGTNSAGHARRQNELAAQVLGRPGGIVAIEEGGGRRIAVPHDPRSAATAERATVGPADGGGYDVCLPLSSEQIRHARTLLDRG